MTQALLYWGASTAGHQIDGNDTYSDTTFLEHVQPTVFKEPAGTACMSWERWREDVDCVAALGLNAYRFSIEWARVEPEQGHYDESALDQYEHMVNYCHEKDITPWITLNHFTAPHWFACKGSWSNPDAPKWFTAYVKRVVERIGDRVGGIVTFNEPNLSEILYYGSMPKEAWDFQRMVLDAASEKAGVEHYRLGNVQVPEIFDLMAEGYARAHVAARTVIRSIVPDVPVGLSLSVCDDAWLDEEGKETVARKRRDCYERWVDAVQGDDFIGVQNYERIEYNVNGIVTEKFVTCGCSSACDSASEDAESVQIQVPLNDMGTPIAAESLANAVTYIHMLTGLPIVVTEHGMSTHDDTLRCKFIEESLPLLVDRIQQGIPVLGYFHWSLIDNFEWISAYDSQLGLYSVNREDGSYARVPKPSADVYRRTVQAMQKRLA